MRTWNLEEQLLGVSQLYLTSSLIQNYSGDLNSLVALHELYKYINKYYDQVSAFPGRYEHDLLLFLSNQKHPRKINN